MQASPPRAAAIVPPEKPPVAPPRRESQIYRNETLLRNGLETGNSVVWVDYRQVDGNDFLRKVLILGAPGVGKSSFMHRYVSGLFWMNYTSTQGGLD